MSDKQKRAAVEMAHGRKFTDDEWQRYRPDNDETLSEVFVGLSPRITEHEYELAAIIGAGKVAHRVVENEWLQSGSRAIRSRLFGKADAPFTTLANAEEWVRHESGDNEAYYAAIDEERRICGLPADSGEGLREEFDDLADTLGIGNATTERQQGRERTHVRNEQGARARATFEQLRATLPHLIGEVSLAAVADLLDARRPHVWIQSGRGDEEGTAWVRELSGDPNWESVEPAHPEALTLGGWHHAREGWFTHLPGEYPYEATTPNLVLLAHGAEAMADESQCWSYGQATAFILTGIIPDLPHMRIWVGGPRALIEVYGAVSYRETRELSRLLRERAGVEKKKSFTPEDTQVIEFVETRPRAQDKAQWTKWLVEWNEQHPDRPFGAGSTLQNTYKRAKKREGRP